MDNCPLSIDGGRGDRYNPAQTANAAAACGYGMRWFERQTVARSNRGPRRGECLMAESDIPRREDVFEVDRIRRLVDLMREYDLREIDLRQANQRIRLCRGVEATAPLVAAP